MATPEQIREASAHLGKIETIDWRMSFPVAVEAGRLSSVSDRPVSSRLFAKNSSLT